MVPLVQTAVNVTDSDATASAPFSLMFGRRFVHSGQHDAVSEAAWEFMEKQQWLIKKIYPMIAERNAMVKAKRKKYVERRRLQLTQPLEIGQRVYARDPTRIAKWDVLYEGPYEVIGKTRDMLMFYVNRMGPCWVAILRWISSRLGLVGRVMKE